MEGHRFGDALFRITDKKRRCVIISRIGTDPSHIIQL